MIIKTKDLILNAAIELLWLHGYHGTSILDISRSCKIQKSSFYSHFSSKESLLLTIVKDCNSDMVSGFNDSTIGILENLELTRNKRSIFIKSFLENNKQLEAIIFVSTETEGNIANIGRPIQHLLNGLSEMLSNTSCNEASDMEKISQLEKYIGSCVLSRVYHNPRLIAEDN